MVYTDEAAHSKEISQLWQTVSYQEITKLWITKIIEQLREEAKGRTHSLGCRRDKGYFVNERCLGEIF